MKRLTNAILLAALVTQSIPIRLASEGSTISTKKVIRVKMQEIMGLSVRDEINIPIAIRAAPIRRAPSNAFKKMSQLGVEIKVTAASKTTTGASAKA